ncbi:MAG: molecular chaperone DnaJ [Candidatus Portnoybacteria bacterium RBG_13_41_18]|uniref:Chaperone protein DnaJ n=1 Tax=Candidatus Portnoybacteria bacterium RBG_13_41_18 TaxID=1801991 RepID=A0A1G2F921_9BACT|nr:MAG: molecular chaperone DnaJ [Candidatus Portnoybacteria bacterium RBG_13_41_18]
MPKDYYEILGVAKNASPDEIKRAYRKLAHEFHPDKGGDAEKFKQINEAYQVLGDPQKRAQYDQFGANFEQARAGGGFGGFNGFRDFSSYADAFDFFKQGGQGSEFEYGNLGDIFEQVFGNSSRRSSRGAGRKQKGQDFSLDAEITLDEAASGAEKEFNLYLGVFCSRCGGSGAEPGSAIHDCLRCKGRGQIEETRSAGFFSFSQVKICPECQGIGKKPEKVCSRCGGDGRVKEYKNITVKIPTGIEDGQIISLRGQGEAGKQGAPPGDLYITIHIKPHKLFQRQGENLYLELEISFTQAVLGDKIEIPTLFGSVELKIPDGIESGTVIRLKDKGISRLSGRGYGDLLVKIKIKTPKKLSRSQKDLIERLKEEGL